jgi:hypothetical protein
MNEITTIPVAKDVRDRLKQYGIKRETYNDILKRLMNEVDYESWWGASTKNLKRKINLWVWMKSDEFWNNAASWCSKILGRFNPETKERPKSGIKSLETDPLSKVDLNKNHRSE